MVWVVMMVMTVPRIIMVVDFLGGLVLELGHVQLGLVQLGPDLVVGVRRLIALGRFAV